MPASGEPVNVKKNSNDNKPNELVQPSTSESTKANRKSSADNNSPAPKENKDEELNKETASIHATNETKQNNLDNNDNTSVKKVS